MNYLNLNIEMSTFTSAYIPCGGILSCKNVQEIDNHFQVSKWICTDSRGIEIHKTGKTQGQILSEFHAWIRGYLVSTHYMVP